MPARRLEDRIREMCGRALSAQNQELDSILSELKAALREHTQRLRNVAAAKLTGGKANQPGERRTN